MAVSLGLNQLKRKRFRTLSLLCDEEPLSDSQLKAYQTRLQEYQTFLEAVGRLALCGNVCVTEEAVTIGEHGLLTGESLNALQHAGAISVYNTLQQNNWEFPIAEDGEVAVVKTHNPIPDEFLDSEKPIRSDWPAIHISECFVDGERAKIHGSVRPLRTFLPPTVVFRNAADIDEDIPESELNVPNASSFDGTVELVPSAKGITVKRVNKDTKEVEYVPIEEYYFGRQEGTQNYYEEKGDFRFKCAVCQRIFYSNVKLMSHILGHVDEVSQAGLDVADVTHCHQCDILFPTAFDYRAHMDQEHSKTYTEISTLITPESNPIVAQTASQLLMQQRDSITAHEDAIIAQSQPTTISVVLPCRICGKETNSELALAHHLQSSHRQREMPYVCRLCLFRSSLFEDILDHFKKLHDNSNHLLCTYCLRIFTPSDARSPHYASPTGNANLGPGVGQTQVYLQHLRMHQIRTQLRRCPTCKLNFTNKSDYQVHRRLDHKAVRDEATARPDESGIDSYEATDQTVRRLKETQPHITLMNAPEAGGVMDLALLRLPSVVGQMSCLECGEAMDSDAHKRYLPCSLCRFATCCSAGYNRHISRVHVYVAGSQPTEPDSGMPMVRPIHFQWIDDEVTQLELLDTSEQMTTTGDQPLSDPAQLKTGETTEQEHITQQEQNEQEHEQEEQQKQQHEEQHEQEQEEQLEQEQAEQLEQQQEEQREQEQEEQREQEQEEQLEQEQEEQLEQEKGEQLEQEQAMQLVQEQEEQREQEQDAQLGQEQGEQPEQEQAMQPVQEQEEQREQEQEEQLEQEQAMQLVQKQEEQREQEQDAQLRQEQEEQLEQEKGEHREQEQQEQLRQEEQREQEQEEKREQEQHEQEQQQLDIDGEHQQPSPIDLQIDELLQDSEQSHFDTQPTSVKNLEEEPINELPERTVEKCVPQDEIVMMGDECARTIGAPESVVENSIPAAAPLEPATEREAQMEPIEGYETSSGVDIDKDVNFMVPQEATHPVELDVTESTVAHAPIEIEDEQTTDNIIIDEMKRTKIIMRYMASLIDAGRFACSHCAASAMNGNTLARHMVEECGASIATLNPDPLLVKARQEAEEQYRLQQAQEQEQADTAILFESSDVNMSGELSAVMHHHHQHQTERNITQTGEEDVVMMSVDSNQMTSYGFMESEDQSAVGTHLVTQVGPNGTTIDVTNANGEVVQQFLLPDDLQLEEGQTLVMIQGEDGQPQLAIVNQADLIDPNNQQLMMQTEENQANNMLLYSTAMEGQHQMDDAVLVGQEEEKENHHYTLG